MLFCRAAFGTLALSRAAPHIGPMMIRKLQSGPFADRARRSVREIALAFVLTFAALVFVIAALYRSGPRTASIPAPPQEQQHAPHAAQPVEGQAIAPAERAWRLTKDL